MQDIPPGLTHDIKALLAGADDDPMSLLAPVSALRRELRLAITSYAGLELAIFTRPQPVRVIAMESVPNGEVITASLRVSLSAVSPGRLDGTALAFATSPGAFADFATDIANEYNLETGDLRLDQDIPDRQPISGITGWREISSINQAIGVLIARGQDPNEAPLELQRLADQASITVEEQATRLITKPPSE